MSSQSVHVAAAVIENNKGEVLLALRPKDKHQGGLWEFPGGKVEVLESVKDALVRELKEELGIMVSCSSPLIRIHHAYPDKSVLLDVWRVTAFDGKPRGCEGQDVRWVAREDLRYYDFPAANRPIVSAAILPDNYLITGQFETPEAFFERLQVAFEAGIKLIQFRAPWLEPRDYRYLAAKAAKLSGASGGRLLLKGDVALLTETWVDGLHLTSGQLHKLYETGWCYKGDKLLAASCHSVEELFQAAQVGCGFVTLSPVRETASHPGVEPLGVEHAAKLTDMATLPVYWLGGMRGDDKYEAKSAGAQGVAGISCYW